jgi:Uma2 family endonuclease
MKRRLYKAPTYEDAGPFRVANVPPGSGYELSHGHPIYCEPTGGDGSRGTIAGAEVLDTDPAVDEAGVDTGYNVDPGGAETLRAPDIAVGNVPDKPGWVRGVPPLALEYAGSGQDEKKLQDKIADLLEAGTRWVWVVRLVGPRRVEVYTRDQPMQLVGPGEELRAPGVLQNPVQIEALFDRRTAHEVTLRNLLQRKGYADLDAVREEGRANALLAVLSARGLEVSDDERARILACRDGAVLDAWIRRAATVDKLADVLGM